MVFFLFLSERLICLLDVTLLKAFFAVSRVVLVSINTQIIGLYLIESYLCLSTLYFLAVERLTFANPWGLGPKPKPRPSPMD
jgi:hypothetical protein